MDALEAIFTRQSIAEVKPDPIPHDLVQKLLSAAVQAPNHYKVRPWRFVVMTGKGKEKFGEALAQAFAVKFPQAPDAAQEKERLKAQRAPLIIAVGVDRPADPRVIEVENICAAAAAVENLLLATHALGLAAKWRTGEEARDAHIKEFLGFASDQHVVALIYIGYPLEAPKTVERPGYEDRTTWME